jgi:hypothetical protein
MLLGACLCMASSCSGGCGGSGRSSISITKKRDAQSESPRGITCCGMPSSVASLSSASFAAGLHSWTCHTNICRFRL